MSYVNEKLFEIVNPHCIKVPTGGLYRNPFVNRPYCGYLNDDSSCRLGGTCLCIKCKDIK